MNGRGRPADGRTPDSAAGRAVERHAIRRSWAGCFQVQVAQQHVAARHEQHTAAGRHTIVGEGKPPAAGTARIFPRNRHVAGIHDEQRCSGGGRRCKRGGRQPGPPREDGDGIDPTGTRVGVDGDGVSFVGVDGIEQAQRQGPAELCVVQSRYSGRQRGVVGGRISADGLHAAQQAQDLVEVRPSGRAADTGHRGSCKARAGRGTHVGRHAQVLRRHEILNRVADDGGRAELVHLNRKAVAGAGRRTWARIHPFPAVAGGIVRGREDVGIGALLIIKTWAGSRRNVHTRWVLDGYVAQGAVAGGGAIAQWLIRNGGATNIHGHEGAFIGTQVGAGNGAGVAVDVRRDG
ncbi:hypothetical protein [Hymenobacter sediminicola]|uniref:hypothetical protein n=1 Tax=Hymenobacter sediminicola TaxID=2761579 RepID=UPI003D816DEA